MKNLVATGGYCSSGVHEEKCVIVCAESVHFDVVGKNINPFQTEAKNGGRKLENLLQVSLSGIGDQSKEGIKIEVDLSPDELGALGS